MLTAMIYHRILNESSIIIPNRYRVLSWLFSVSLEMIVWIYTIFSTTLCVTWMYFLTLKYLHTPPWIFVPWLRWISSGYVTNVFFYVSEFNFLTFTKASHTYNKVFHTYTNKRTHKHLITEELLRQRMPLTYLWHKIEVDSVYT